MDPEDLHYHEKHAWVREEGDELIIGITDYAQEQLGEVIFIELPEKGAPIVRDDPFGSIESAKAVEDLVSPVSGVVTRRNEDLLDAPETVNDDPLGEGWMIAVKPDEDAKLDELMSYDEYQQHLEMVDLDEDEDEFEEDEFDEDEEEFEFEEEEEE